MTQCLTCRDSPFSILCDCGRESGGRALEYISAESRNSLFYSIITNTKPMQSSSLTAIGRKTISISSNEREDNSVLIEKKATTDLLARNKTEGFTPPSTAAATVSKSVQKSLKVDSRNKSSSPSSLSEDLASPEQGTKRPGSVDDSASAAAYSGDSNQPQKKKSRKKNPLKFKPEPIVSSTIPESQPQPKEQEILPSPIGCRMCSNSIQPKVEEYYEYFCGYDINHPICNFTTHKACLQNFYKEKDPSLKKHSSWKNQPCVTDKCDKPMLRVNVIRLNGETELLIKSDAPKLKPATQVSLNRQDKKPKQEKKSKKDHGTSNEGSSGTGPPKEPANIPLEHEPQSYIEERQASVTHVPKQCEDRENKNVTPNPMRVPIIAAKTIPLEKTADETELKYAVKPETTIIKTKNKKQKKIITTSFGQSSAYAEHGFEDYDHPLKPLFSESKHERDRSEVGTSSIVSTGKTEEFPSKINGNPIFPSPSHPLAKQFQQEILDSLSPIIEDLPANCPMFDENKSFLLSDLFNTIFLLAEISNLLNQSQIGYLRELVKGKSNNQNLSKFVSGLKYFLLVLKDDQLFYKKNQAGRELEERIIVKCTSTPAQAASKVTQKKVHDAGVIGQERTKQNLIPVVSTPLSHITDAKISTVTGSKKEKTPQKSKRNERARNVLIERERHEEKFITSSSTAPSDELEERWKAAQDISKSTLFYKPDFGLTPSFESSRTMFPRSNVGSSSPTELDNSHSIVQQKLVSTKIKKADEATEQTKLLEQHIDLLKRELDDLKKHNKEQQKVQQGLTERAQEELHTVKARLADVTTRLVNCQSTLDETKMHLNMEQQLNRELQEQQIEARANSNMEILHSMLSNNRRDIKLTQSSMSHIRQIIHQIGIKARELGNPESLVGLVTYFRDMLDKYKEIEEALQYNKIKIETGDFQTRAVPPTPQLTGFALQCFQKVQVHVGHSYQPLLDKYLQIVTNRMNELARMAEQSDPDKEKVRCELIKELQSRPNFDLAEAVRNIAFNLRLPNYDKANETLTDQSMASSSSFRASSPISLNKRSSVNSRWVGSRDESVRSLMNIEEVTCEICLEYVLPHQKQQSCLQCQQKYHEKCIRPWAEKERTCPHCRAVYLLRDEYPTVGR